MINDLTNNFICMISLRCMIKLIIDFRFKCLILHVFEILINYELKEKKMKIIFKTQNI